ncbi:MAG: DUF3348 family protein [Gammaproteobacteria bacterium]|nr:DUF3348 family protein [Gammaproteobacteria bacterium]
MTRAALPAAGDGPRFVRLLSGLAALKNEPTPAGFTESMEALIGFAQSMKLAMLHDELAATEYVASPEPVSYETLMHEVLEVRQALIRGVLQSFEPAAAPSRRQLPRPGADVPDEALLTFEPYHRFYAAHQREFDARIHRLQLRVREALSGRSASLARLVALDENLRELVSAQTRKSLAAIPNLLGRRFDALLKAAQGRDRQDGDDEVDTPGNAPGATAFGAEGWLQGFYRDMQDLLLAELDLRLMPVLGLVEAVEEEVTREQ